MYAKRIFIAPFAGISIHINIQYKYIVTQSHISVTDLTTYQTLGRNSWQLINRLCQPPHNLLRDGLIYYVSKPISHLLCQAYPGQSCTRLRHTEIPETCSLIGRDSSMLSIKLPGCAF